MNKRGGGKRTGGREYHDLSSKICCLTVPKILPSASKLCCPTHCAMRTIGMEFLTKVCEIIEIFGTTATRTRTYRFSTLLSHPLYHENHWNGISDKSQFDHRNIGHDRDSNSDLLLENPIVLTPLLSFIFE